MKRFLVVMGFTFISLSTAMAQISTEGRGYVFEPTVLSKPNVRIPSEAKKTGIGGHMRVQVTVDANGNVISAGSVSGPGAVCRHVDREDVLALREAAKEAALQTKFAPLTNNVVSTTVVSFDVEGERDNFENALISGYELPPSRGDEKRFSAANARSSSSGDQPSETLSGGALNGKATALPKPSFPPAARAVRATGSVPVQVLIDEKGKVFLARATGGHPLLRTAAASAACDANFMPTLLSGKPVKVSGMITYNFVQ